MPAIASDIITLQEAKDFLNITNSTSDAKIQDFIGAASQSWVNRVGPVDTTVTYSEWYDGGRDRIVLRHTPVAAVQAVHESWGTSITYTLTEEVLDGGQAADAYGYTIDLDAGILTRRANGVPISFARGELNIHVTYTAGYGTVPADIKQAVKVLVEHLWQTQRGGSLRPGRGDDAITGTSYWWPNRVQEVAQAYIIPGIA